MAQDIIKNIPLALDINAKKRLNGTIDIQLYSKDVATGQFEFKFIDEDGDQVVLNETYSAQALVRYEDEEKTYLDDMTIEGNVIRFIFPHDFITKDGTITMYIYITKDNYTSDVAAISFPVFVSEIDKDLDPSISVHYIGKIEQLIEDMKDEISSYQIDVDEIIEGYEESISKLQTLETNYEPQLASLTTQLAQKVGQGKKAELEDLSPTVLGAIEGGEGTSFELLSEPQDSSVTINKLSPHLKNSLTIPVKQLITNGNFEDGVVGFGVYAAQNSVSGDNLINASLGTSSYHSLTKVTEEGLMTGDKIYIEAKVKLNSPNVSSIRLQAKGSTGSTVVIERVNLPASDNWITLKGVFEVVDQSGKLEILVMHYYADSQAGRIMEVEYLTAFSLTKINGTGKEPTLTEVDSFLSDFPKRYFKGEVNFFNIRNIGNGNGSGIEDFLTEINENWSVV